MLAYTLHVSLGLCTCTLYKYVRNTRAAMGLWQLPVTRTLVDHLCHKVVIVAMFPDSLWTNEKDCKQQGAAPRRRPATADPHIVYMRCPDRFETSRSRGRSPRPSPDETTTFPAPSSSRLADWTIFARRRRLEG